MLEISTEFYTHIGVRKDKSEFYMTKKWSQDWENTRKDWYGGFLVLRDIQWFVIFKWTADLIEEVREINVEKEQEKERLIKMEEEDNHKRAKNRNKKQEWTKIKLQELKDDEIEYFIDMARDKLRKAHNSDITKKIVWDKFILEYWMCLLRKYFKCPYN